MKTYNVLIVDDEPLARKVIKDFLEKLAADIKIHEEGDPVAALAYLSSQPVDILYLDINMPGLSGLDVAKKVDTKVITVFTTAYAEYALDAFELAAFDYLVKPISLSRFMKSYDRIIETLEGGLAQTVDYVLVKEGKRTYRLKADGIYRLQAYGDYVKIFTADKMYLVKARLASYEASLGERFTRVHRSHIINLDHIAFFEGNIVHVAGENIPISESLLPGLKNLL